MCCFRAKSFIGLVTLAFAGALNLVSANTLIDNFERPNAPSPWRFGNGPEFPGATGSLTAGAGYSGTGAHLAYDLPNTSNWDRDRHRNAVAPIPDPRRFALVIDFSLGNLRETNSK